MLIRASVAADLFDSEDGELLEGWTRCGEQLERTSRWEEHKWLVLQNDAGEYWGVYYREGLTEIQETVRPWDEPGDPYRLLEMRRLYPHAVNSVVFRTTEPRTGVEGC